MWCSFFTFFLLVCTFYCLTLSRVQMVQLVGAYKTVINSFSCLQLFNRFSVRNEEIIQDSFINRFDCKIKAPHGGGNTFYAGLQFIYLIMERVIS